MRVIAAERACWPACACKRVQWQCQSHRCMPHMKASLNLANGHSAVNGATWWLLAWPRSGLCIQPCRCTPRQDCINLGL